MATRPGPNSIQIGEWIADPDDDSIARGETRQRIDPRSMRLLLCLARSPGEVLSQNFLLDEVWRGVVVSPASIYQNISQLRKALGDTESPPSYIETVSRKGYRLVAQVRPLAPQLPAAPPVAPSATPVLGAPSPRRSRWWLVAAVVATAAIGAALLLRTAPAEADSIVVMPIEDMTPSGDQQAFCDGMTEELSNSLAQLPGLRVVARTSAFAIRDRKLDAREIGKQLNATIALEGSLRHSGNLMRLTLRLIDTKTGLERWSRAFNVLNDDPLLIQEQISRQVAENLQLRMTLETNERLSQRRSENAKANLAYVLARSYQLHQTRADNAQAIVLYRQALDLDPRFVPAKIGLIFAYMNQQQYEDRPTDDIAHDVDALLAELESQSEGLPDFFIARGMWRNDHFEHDAAIADLKHAIELDPQSSKALANLALIYLTKVEPRLAEPQIEAAALLDPYSAGINSVHCMILTDLGRFGDARRKCDLATSIEPGSQSALSAVSDLEVAQGDAAAALKANTAALHANGDVGELYADRGRWLMRLSLVQEAHRAYQAAVAATGDNGGANVGVATLGLRAALAVDGPMGVRALIERGKFAATEDPELLFQLAEIELMMHDARAARHYVDRALATKDFKPEMLASRWDMRTGRTCLLIAAAALRATGEPARANQFVDQAHAMVEQLLDAGVRRHDIFFIRAKVEAMRGNGDAAMRALQTAEEFGWRYTWLAEYAPYFDTLRTRPDYRALIARISARNAADGARVLALISGPPAR